MSLYFRMWNSYGFFLCRRMLISLIEIIYTSYSLLGTCESSCYFSNLTWPRVFLDYRRYLVSFLRCFVIPSVYGHYLFLFLLYFMVSPFDEHYLSSLLLYFVVSPFNGHYLSSLLPYFVVSPFDGHYHSLHYFQHFLIANCIYEIRKFIFHPP